MYSFPKSTLHKIDSNLYTIDCRMVFNNSPFENLLNTSFILDFITYKIIKIISINNSECTYLLESKDK